MSKADFTTDFTLSIEGVGGPLRVSAFELDEGISQLFELVVTFASEEKDLPLADLVGKSAQLSIAVEKSDTRWVHGVVARARHGEPGTKLAFYQITVVPRLFRLQHRRDSRIFQDKSVPEIVKAVLSGAEVDAVRWATTGSYAPREYCVQYRESDLAFVSRLCEEEGIAWHFEHEDGAHTLVFSDAPAAFTAVPAPDTVPYRKVSGALGARESVARFASSQEVRPGKVSLSDYNFKKPSLSQEVASEASADTDLEIYDYPGEYDLPGAGSAYAKVRLEELQATRVVAEGASDCPRLMPGFTFSLADHPRESENKSWLLVHVHHRGTSPVMGEGHEAHGCSNTFRCIPAGVPFRPVRKTPRPTIKGVQTAFVTGPGGEEIHTDEHGRVKVHFHWDRAGSRDDKSSCWVRVSQLWAGAGWGAMWIPRVGHEVVVDFLEGDPDRPLIVGRVYHGANVPPYALPGDKTKSTIKSNSSMGGGGYNELRFEDKKGSEEIFLHGQKDWTIQIEHDKDQEIGNDESLKVGHDREIHVNNDQSVTIGNNQTVNVGSNHSETIGATETITVGAASTHTVGGVLTETVGLAKLSTVGGSLTEVVAQKMSVSVGGAREETTQGTFTESVAKDAATTIGGKLELSVQKAMTTTVADNHAISVGKKQSVAVGEEHTLTVGDGKVTIKKNGDITIEGKKIVIKGSGPIKLEGSDVSIKASGSVSVEASSAVKVKGSSVAVN